MFGIKTRLRRKISTFLSWCISDALDARMRRLEGRLDALESTVRQLDEKTRDDIRQALSCGQQTLSCGQQTLACVRQTLACGQETQNRTQHVLDEMDSNLLNRLNRMMQTNLSTAALHAKTFGPFRGINAGRDVVVVAGGPSVAKFKPLENCVYIGINHAFLKENLSFDYMFVHDLRSIRKVIDKLNAYRPGKCIKFYGLLNEHHPEDNGCMLVSESDARAADALRYRTDFAPIPAITQENASAYTQFAYDLSTMPIGDCFSTVFTALQFALWTAPRRIYVVGCDCSQGGHFFSEDLTSPQTDPEVYRKMMEPWRRFKIFADRYYPGVEIVSVNPVGLRGLFKDLDQMNGGQSV